MYGFKVENGDFVFESGRLALVKGVEATRRNILNSLRMNRGEWFLNSEAGFPWFLYLGRKNVAEQKLASEVKRVLCSHPETKEVVFVNVNFDRKQRKVNIKFRIRLTNGDDWEEGFWNTA